MAQTWKLIPTTFAPAEVADLTGVPTGTQRQWWNRGLLGDRSAGRARVSLRETLAISILAECQPSNIGLKTVARALPALTGSGLLKLAFDSLPWKFQGTEAEERRFRSWFEQQEDLGSDHILRLLGVKFNNISRYLTVSSEGIRHFNDFTKFDEVEHRSLVIFLDSWGLASRLKESIKSDMFTVTRRSTREE